MNKVSYFMLSVLALCALFLVGCDDSKVETKLTTPVYKTGLGEKEYKLDPFMKIFPEHAASYERNNESEIMTEYKGSINYRKNDNVNPLRKGFKHAQPYLKNLWLGYPFMYEYNEARGHTLALHDVLEIDRINRYQEKGGLPATCWNCKTPQMVPLLEEYGDKFWAMDVNEFRSRLDPDQDSISCATCHNSETMELQLYSAPLKDWLVRSGKDITKISRNEMRSLVCAQCHVEYYFTDPGQGVSKKPVFPWDNGFGPEDMYEYYKGHGDGKRAGFEGQFTDWTHPASNTPMIKVQHPEYETWIDGPHGAAGVSCADCHMPYVLAKDKQKMSSHWWTSPLKDAEMRACRQCHSDKSPEYLRERVLYTQKKSYEQLLIAQEYSVKAHEAVRLASLSETKSFEYDALILEARQNVRKGQLFWDYVSAENSVGFHNPAKTLDTLAKSIVCSQKAIDLAMKAANFSIAAELSQDITTLVPPILEMSRKLQQDPEYLKSHKWLDLLKPLPEAQLVWEGGKKIR